MFNTCAVFAAGEYNIETVPNLDNTLILAADAGIRYLGKIGVKPDAIIGDFDSNGSIPQDGKVLIYPKVKNDTDTMLCVKYGLENGCKEFKLYGCLGGNIDHTIANIQTLSYIAENGGIGYIISETETITAIKNSSAQFSERGRFSVFALSDIAKQVTIKGAAYNCDNIDLSSTFPLGVSNEFKADNTEISVKSGLIHIVWHQGIINKFPKIKRI